MPAPIYKVVESLTGSGGGGGVTDHGALTGLADDDHPQYHNDTRGDVRYYTKAQIDALAPKSGTSTITVTAPGGFEHTETVAATGITGSMRVLVSLGDHDDTDENTAELLDILGIEAEAGTAQITYRLSFGTKTSGPIKLNYIAL